MHSLAAKEIHTGGGYRPRRLVSESIIFLKRPHRKSLMHFLYRLEIVLVSVSGLRFAELNPVMRVVFLVRVTCGKCCCGYGQIKCRGDLVCVGAAEILKYGVQNLKAVGRLDSGIRLGSQTPWSNYGIQLRNYKYFHWKQEGPEWIIFEIVVATIISIFS